MPVDRPYPVKVHVPQPYTVEKKVPVHIHVPIPTPVIHETVSITCDSLWFLIETFLVH